MLSMHRRRGLVRQLHRRIACIHVLRLPFYKGNLQNAQNENVCNDSKTNILFNETVVRCSKISLIHASHKKLKQGNVDYVNRKTHKRELVTICKYVLEHKRLNTRFLCAC